MSSGAAYYASYKAETEKHNVEPTIISGFKEVWAFVLANHVDTKKPDSRQLRFWSNGGEVYHTIDGRIVELSQTNSAIGTPLLAVFDSRTDYFNYRKAMPLNFYLNH